MAKDYNKIEVKDNMKINEEEEVVQKEEKVKFEKVVDVEPKKVKKSLIGRLVSGVVGPDGLPGIGSYVNNEIVKPAIKNIIVDAVTSGINMVMYGDKGGGRGGYRPNITGGRGVPPRTHYNQYNQNYRPQYSTGPDVQPTERVARPTSQGVDEYMIEDRHGASQVLVNLTESADRYGSVSVADYYDLIGVPSKYTDNNYGWTYESMKHASIIPARGGYVIRFPAVELI